MKYFVIFLSALVLFVTSCTNPNFTGRRDGEVSFDVAEMAKVCSSAFSRGIYSR